jgi:hypothetical protein
MTKDGIRALIESLRDMAVYFSGVGKPELAADFHSFADDLEADVESGELPFE